MAEPESNCAASYRPIAHYPGYRVGDDGSVWCNKVRGSRGTAIGEWRRLKLQVVKRHRYLHAELCHDGKRRKFLVHRLVLNAFVGPCPIGQQCLHDDNNRGNNTLSNLRWGTPKGNQADRRRHGTSLHGAQVATAKLTASDVSVIRRLYASGDHTQQEIADLFGVSRSNISVIVTRKGWAR
jgi:DNA-binding CsgD family transcriptional regulator